MNEAERLKLLLERSRQLADELDVNPSQELSDELQRIGDEILDALIPHLERCVRPKLRQRWGSSVTDDQRATSMFFPNVLGDLYVKILKQKEDNPVWCRLCIGRLTNYMAIALHRLMIDIMKNRPERRRKKKEYLVEATRTAKRREQKIVDRFGVTAEELEEELSMWRHSQDMDQRMMAKLIDFRVLAKKSWAWISEEMEISEERARMQYERAKSRLTRTVEHSFSG